MWVAQLAKPIFPEALKAYIHIHFNKQFKLLPPNAMPVQMRHYYTKHRCIHSTPLSSCKMDRLWSEILVSAWQHKMFNSETFTAIVNVNVTKHLLGNSLYFVDKSGCSKMLKSKLKGTITNWSDIVFFLKLCILQEERLTEWKMK